MTTSELVRKVSLNEVITFCSDENGIKPGLFSDPTDSDLYMIKSLIFDFGKINGTKIEFGFDFGSLDHELLRYIYTSEHNKLCSLFKFLFIKSPYNTTQIFKLKDEWWIMKVLKVESEEWSPAGPRFKSMYQQWFSSSSKLKFMIPKNSYQYLIIDGNDGLKNYIENNLC